MIFLKPKLTENKQKGKTCWGFPLFSEWGQRSVRWCVLSPAHTHLLCSKHVALNYFLRHIVLPPQDPHCHHTWFCTWFENTLGAGRGSVWACVLQSRSSNTTTVPRDTFSHCALQVWNDGKEQKDIKVWTTTTWTRSFGWNVLEIHLVNVQNDTLSG